LELGKNDDVIRRENERRAKGTRAHACPLRKNSTSSETDQRWQARARTWASGNKLTPQKANSRRKMFKEVLGQLHGHCMTRSSSPRPSTVHSLLV
jgi:hypothetical protein